MASKTRNPSTGGTPGGGGTNNAQPPGPGSLFRVPKFSTRRRFVPDAKNESVPFVPNAGGELPVGFTQLEQLDIVTGMKLFVTGLKEEWTQGAAQTLHVSPFFPASSFATILFKLQAAYNSFNQTGPLAAIAQAFRPIFGSRASGLVNPNVFAKPSVVTPPTFGAEFDMADLAIDIPLSIKFDEYWDLDAKGNPLRRIYDAVVTPQFMAAQARVVTPTVKIAQHMTVSDLLGGPIARAAADNLSTYAVVQPGTCNLFRNAFWTASNPAANPPQFPWQYTRDYFTQAVQGQPSVSVLIQNTGVSVGQVMALYGFIWDPDANGGLGACVSLKNAIEEIQIVTGGSLLNKQYTPSAVIDKMQSLNPNLLVDFPDGVFVLDFAMHEDGGYLSNEEVINTYIVNGVACIFKFKATAIPGARSTVYLGVEALKMATS